MAIDITLRPRKYTLDELRELYNRYSTDESDFDEWISAMQITGQIARREDNYIPAGMETTKPKKVKPFTKEFEAVLAGGSSEIKYPRFGIRTLIKERTRVDPVEMKLIAYQNKNGRWIDVPEKPVLSLQSPREAEKWRAEVVGLRGARSKYPIIVANTDKGIKGTRLIVEISGTMKTYFSKLILWGFDLECMITFGITRTKAENPRDLEIHGYKFPFETFGAITKELATYRDKACDILREWLLSYNIEYYNLLTSSASGELCEGEGISPLQRVSRKNTELQLLDLNAKTVSETRARASAILPRDWPDMAPRDVAKLFELISDEIKQAKGYHGRNITGTYGKLISGQTTLKAVLERSKKGEGFAKTKKKK